MTEARPIPKSAKKVFSGGIFEVYQWRQKMFDGSFKTFERATRQGTVEIIGLTNDRKIILLRQRQPDSQWFFSLPSGRLDKKGESPRQAAIRELAEETGYVAGRMKLWQAITSPSKLLWTINIFLAHNCRLLKKQLLDSGEKIAVQLISFADLLLLSENSAFHCSGHLRFILIRAKYSAQHRLELKKLLFKKQ